MTRPRKSDPDVVERAQRIAAEQEESRRQVQAGEPRRRGHRSSSADDTPDDNPEHPEE